MIDLEKISGLPLLLDLGSFHLHFGEGLPPVEPHVRTLADSRAVLLDPSAEGPSELYYMYRDIHREVDEEVIRRHGLRYDITILRPGRVGREYVKTVGHYHPKKPGQDLSYPEVYEVLYGRAHYLLQKPTDDFQGVQEVILVEAGPGQKVVIPPNYGHTTINPGNLPLVMANWTADGFASNYAPMREHRGSAYHEAVEGGERTFLPNPRYPEVPALRERVPREIPEFGLMGEKPMYQACIEDPTRFRFLTHPEEFEALWAAEGTWGS